MARAKVIDKSGRPGRPKSMEKAPDIAGQVATSLDENEYAKLKEIGKEHGLCFATLMRIVCENYLNDLSGVHIEEGIIRTRRVDEPLESMPKLMRVSFILTPSQKKRIEFLAIKRKVSESAVLRGFTRHFLSGSNRVFTIAL